MVLVSACGSHTREATGETAPEPTAPVPTDICAGKDALIVSMAPVANEQEEGEFLAVSFRKGDEKLFVETFAEEDAGTDTPVRVAWRGDLNGDKRDDYLLKFSDCGSYNDCGMAGLANCRDDLYVVVLARNYFFELDVAEQTTSVGGQRWLRLDEVEQTENRQDLILYYHHFDGTMYQRREKGSLLR